MGIISEYRIEEKFQHNVLSVIFDSDSFFYAISDINNNLNIAVKYRLEQEPIVAIPKIIEQETLSSHYYSTVNIFSRINKFSFIPTSEYSYGNELSLIRNSFELGGDMLSTDLSALEGINIIHAYPSIFREAFSSLSGNESFRHLGLAYAESGLNDGVFVSLYEKSISIVVRMKTKLLYYNQFTTSTDEDRMYYIMLAYDQLGLDTTRDALYLIAPELIKKDLKILLSNYIGKFGDDVQTFANMTGSAQDIHDLYLASICE